MMDPLDLRDLINRIRRDTTLDPETKITVSDLAYLEDVAAFLESLHHSSGVTWWAISEEGGISTEGDKADIEEWCDRYPSYRPERVETSRWMVHGTRRGESPWSEGDDG